MPRTLVIARSEHPARDDRLEFHIDFETGEISDLITVNTNAEYWRREILSFASGESVASFAWQQDYPAPDPLHTPRSLAWRLMARGWKLEGELGTIQPPLPDAIPEGALA